jgi:hypothetical protein
MMGTKVKDKVYYMSEHLGVPKSWVPKMLDVSDTTLTKWSYNPLNVSQEMSERIFLRLAILETLGVSFKEITAYLSDTETGAPTPKKFMLVTVGGNVYYVHDVRRRLPSDPPKALVPLVRNALIREENQHPLYIRHRYGPDRRRGALSKMARDETLEMPRGIFKWDKERI